MSDAGFANVADIELTLIDCVRYFHKAAGINGVAQVLQIQLVEVTPHDARAGELREQPLHRKIIQERRHLRLPTRTIPWDGYAPRG